MVWFFHHIRYNLSIFLSLLHSWLISVHLRWLAHLGWTYSTRNASCKIRAIESNNFRRKEEKKKAELSIGFHADWIILRVFQQLRARLTVVQINQTILFFFVCLLTRSRIIKLHISYNFRNRLAWLPRTYSGQTEWFTCSECGWPARSFRDHRIFRVILFSNVRPRWTVSYISYMTAASSFLASGIRIVDRSSGVPRW